MSFNDKVGSTDGVVAGLEPFEAPPRFPCPLCGKETLEHTPDPHGTARRICSAATCRNVINAD